MATHSVKCLVLRNQIDRIKESNSPSNYKELHKRVPKVLGPLNYLHCCALGVPLGLYYKPLLSENLCYSLSVLEVLGSNSIQFGIIGKFVLHFYYQKSQFSVVMVAVVILSVLY